MDLAYLYIAVSVIALTYLYSKVAASQTRTKFMTEHNCKPTPAFKQPKLLFGYDLIPRFVKWARQKNFWENTSRFFVETGDTFSIRMLGVNRIWTIQPENVRAIIQTQGDDFEVSWVRIKALQPIGGDGVVSSNGQTWAHGRALLRPSFSKTQYSNLGVYEEHFQNFIVLIPKDGATFDIQKLFPKLTMDVASEILFGESIYSLKVSEALEPLEIERAFAYATQSTLVRFNMGRLLWLHWDPKFVRATKVIKDFAQKYVDQALEYRRTHPKTDNMEEEHVGTKKYVFLQELAKDTGDSKMIRDQLITVLAGGRSTTAGLLSLVFWHLPRHPQVLQTIRSEIAHLKGAIPTYEQLKSLKYLRAIIDETLRLHPAAPINERVAKRATTLPLGGGPDGLSRVYVPKGQLVLYHAYALHRDPKLWGADAAEFRPERWLALAGSVPRFYVPFGGGARLCPGQQLGLTEASYFIVRILQTFSTLEPRDDRPFAEGLGVVLNSGNGVLLSSKE